MKNIILSIGLIFCSCYYAHAQGLLVTYEEAVTPQVSSSDFSRISDPQIRAAIEGRMKEMSKTRSRTNQLLVNNGVSVYKTGEFEQPNSKTITEITGDNSRGTIQTQSQSFNASPHTIYKNHLDTLMLSQVNSGEKEYLIEEPLAEFKWKIGKKKKKVSGYQCIEATTKTAKGMPVTAWYTPDIPVSEGPASYFGLPGLILYVDINNGSTIYSCTSIEQLDDLTAMNAPDTGEKISRAQYEAMVSERLERIQRDANNRITERRENFMRRGEF